MSRISSHINAGNWLFNISNRDARMIITRRNANRNSASSSATSLPSRRSSARTIASRRSIARTTPSPRQSPRSAASDRR